MIRKDAVDGRTPTAPDIYVRKRFSEYYSTARDIAVKEIEKREFGIGSWEKKIEMRHLSFGSIFELKDYLINDTPFYVSYSAAYYKFPDARPMQRKHWLGGDLIFDIDAEKHACGKFTCAECFADVKERTIKLIEDFLIKDLGFSENELSINFSGSKGYHVHVISNVIRSLRAKERKQIADYISGRGLSYAALFRKEGKRITGPKPDEGGYRGRFAKEVVCRMKTDKKFRKTLHRRLANPSEAEYFIKGIIEGNWDRINISNREKKFEKIIRSLAIKLSDQIDTQVTMDTARLIRLPNSLHGGSSLIAKQIRLSELPGFEPMRDAVVFGKKRIRINIVENVPEITVNDQTYGPFKKGETVELPESTGIYLLCKKAAE